MSWQYVDLWGNEVEPPAGLGPPAQAHSPTSQAAAETVAPNVGQLQLRLLEALRDHGPLTDEGLQEVTGMAANTERPRRVELVARGLVAQVGEGRTASGRRAALWGLTAPA